MEPSDRWAYGYLSIFVQYFRAGGTRTRLPLFLSPKVPFFRPRKDFFNRASLFYSFCVFSLIKKIKIERSANLLSFGINLGMHSNDDMMVTVMPF